MTQSLYLLRHAKAEPWFPGCDDFARVLSDRGQSHMALLSRWMASHIEEPDAVLCSTSARTRGTLAPILEVWPGLAERTRYLDEIYEASTGRLHSLAEQAFEQVDQVLMIGHNPGFEYLATSVLRDRDANRIGKMATGTLGQIDFNGGYSSDCGQGVLRHWVTRKNLG